MTSATITKGRLRLTLLGGTIIVLSLLSLAAVTSFVEGDLGRARRLEAGGDYEAASLIYRSHLANHPHAVEAIKGLAVNLALLGRHDEALPFQEEVCRNDRSDAQTRVELALNYVNHQRRVKAAVPLLREAVDVEPSPRNRALLGQVLSVDGQDEAAEAEWRSLIDDVPTYRYAYELLMRQMERRLQQAELESLLRDAAKHGVSFEPPEARGGT